MKTYIYNFVKYFLVACVVFIGLQGESINAKEVSYNKLLTGESEEKIEVNDLDDGFNISIENSIEEEGHTTAYFSPSKAEDLSDYGAFSFYVENKSQGEIKLNFIINESSRNYILQDDDNILALEDGENTFRRLTVKDGVYELDENFKGTIFIPFSVLKDKYFEDIQSWGLTLTCRNGENKSFDIKDFNYIEKSTAKKFNVLAKVKLEGDTKMPIPAVGESIVDYKIDKPAKFYLKESAKGVSISEEGHLAVQDTAEEGTIRAAVSMEGLGEFYFNVNLETGLTKTLKGVTDKSLAVPSLDEVVNKDSWIMNFFLNEGVIILRCILILGAAFVSGIYLYWRGYFKRFTKDKLEKEN